MAQDSTAYGEDRGDRDGLAVLLEQLAEAVPDVPWIRLMYAYPGRVTRRLAETMAALPNVVPYLDMPLQHGSDAVLRRMKRPSLRKARESIEAVRTAMPDVALRTTFIVGYPGETEREFRSCSRSSRSSASTTSARSRIHRSPAHPPQDEPGQVPERVKQKRYARLMELAQGIALSNNRALVGREVDVLDRVRGAGRERRRRPGRRRPHLPRRTRGRRPRTAQG